jgi:murein DD-endopeptidase MepM/ murein hydrolase activator NlpD
MGSAGDDGVVDPQAQPGPGRSEPEGFDPGIETGYLRRVPRDRELEPELGAAPFDPGPGRYDARRARKQERRRERTERQQARPSHDAEAPVSGPADRGPRSRAEQAAAPVAPAPMALATGGASPAGTARPAGDAEVVELRTRESMAERLERERDGLRPARRRELPRPAPSGNAARMDPGVKGPVRKRARAAENRRRVATRRRGLLWPTAKAGLAVTVALALGAGLGSALGLPVPGLDQPTGSGPLINSASLFGIDPGTPAGLVHGYVFPLRGPHDFGDKIARFGAPRYGHIHEGQDIFGKTGTQEVAVHDGVVVDRGKNSDPDDGGRGNYVVIYSPSDDHSFVYMHMLKPSPVQLGDRVHAGDLVGQLGCTGSCDGPHLHFEVRAGKASLGAETKPLDPLPFLRQWPQSTP